jgi:hypothetical protein
MFRYTCMYVCRYMYIQLIDHKVVAKKRSLDEWVVLSYLWLLFRIQFSDLLAVVLDKTKQMVESIENQSIFDYSIQYLIKHTFN